MPAGPRVETAILVCLFLLGPAWGRARPCPAPPLLLGSAGRGRLGAGAGSERTLTFKLPESGRVWAEASGLSGLDGEDRDAAPEVFLDDAYLGPLLPDDGAVWRSPLALSLSAGWHQLLLRCAEPGGMGPALRWGGLKVFTDGTCAPRARPRPDAASTALPAAVAVRAEAPRLPASLRTFCGPMRVETAWPARFKGRDLDLSSAADGQVADSGPLTSLGFGQAWSARLKIPSASGVQAFPLVARFEPDGAGHVRFLVLVDRQVHGAVQVKALGYRPDAWEPFTVWLCPGRLTVRFAQEGDMDLPYTSARAALSLGALGLTLSLSPSR